MIVSLIAEGLGLTALAVAVPATGSGSPAEQVPFVRTQFDLADVAPRTAPAPAPQRARDERLTAAVVDDVPASTTWTPPAKSWQQSTGGPVVELGALGSRYEWQPDVAHLSLQWQF
jgi:hypothetical protein